MLEKLTYIIDMTTSMSKRMELHAGMGMEIEMDMEIHMSWGGWGMQV